MIENYNDFEAMYDRAIEIGEIIAEIWELDGAGGLDAIAHRGYEINVSGSNDFGDEIEVTFPTRYMEMSDDDIRWDQNTLLAKENQRNADAKKIQEFADKEKRRELYKKLTEEFDINPLKYENIDNIDESGPSK